MKISKCNIIKIRTIFDEICDFIDKEHLSSAVTPICLYEEGCVNVDNVVTMVSHDATCTNSVIVFIPIELHNACDDMRVVCNLLMNIQREHHTSIVTYDRLTGMPDIAYSNCEEQELVWCRDFILDYLHKRFVDLHKDNMMVSMLRVSDIDSFEIEWKNAIKNWTK
jgi:glucan biosynthesis protein